MNHHHHHVGMLKWMAPQIIFSPAGQTISGGFEKRSLHQTWLGNEGSFIMQCTSYIQLRWTWTIMEVTSVCTGWSVVYLPGTRTCTYESETRKNCAQGTVWNTLVIEDNQWYRWEPRRQLLGASGTGKKHDGFNLHRHESIFLSIRPSLVLVYVGIFNLLSFKNFMSSH